MIAQPRGTKKDSAAMVRTYQRKTSTKYSQEELKAAVKAVKEDNMKNLAAAKKFRVPRSTVFDHLKEIHPNIGAGAPTILTPGEEKEIVITLQVLQQIGFGLTKELVGVVVRDYLNDQPLRRNPFHDGIPGKDWWKLFFKAMGFPVEYPKVAASAHASSCWVLTRGDRRMVPAGGKSLSVQWLDRSTL